MDNLKILAGSSMHVPEMDDEDQEFIEAEASLSYDVSELIDSIGTDHAPHTKAEKKAEAPYGVPGVQTMLALMLDAVNKKRLSLQRVVKLTSQNPAKIFNLKNKGLLKQGYDADLTVVDLDLVRQVHMNDLLTKVQWSPFEGKTLKGWPIMTIVNGSIIYRDGSVFER